MQQQDLSECLAFVTGGASGIGFGMAEALAARRMKIAIADIDGPAADEAAKRLAAKGYEAAGFALDIRDRAAWPAVLDAAEKKFGSVAVLCSNAGVAGSRLPIADTNPGAWDWTLEVNLTGTFNAVHAALPRMLARGKPSHIVATASLGGFLPHGGNAAYSAAKAGVIALCESLREELAETLVGVSVLCPGLVKTNLLEANAGRLPGVKLAEPEPALEAAMREATDALVVGEFVVQGLLQDRFWLFSHPELGYLIEARADEIRTANAK